MFTPPYSQLAREHAVSVPQGGPVYREGQTVVFRCTARARPGLGVMMHLGFAPRLKTSKLSCDRSVNRG